MECTLVDNTPRHRRLQCELDHTVRRKSGYRDCSKNLGWPNCLGRRLCELNPCYRIPNCSEIRPSPNSCYGRSKRKNALGIHELRAKIMTAMITNLSPLSRGKAYAARRAATPPVRTYGSSDDWACRSNPSQPPQIWTCHSRPGAYPYQHQPRHADSDEVARAFRDDVARRSEMMPPGSGASLADVFLAFDYGTVNCRWARGMTVWRPEC